MKLPVFNGFRTISNPQDLALAKFRCCPWDFYDGIKDRSPCTIGYGDILVTRTMGSGIGSVLMEQIYKRARHKSTVLLLKTIPAKCDLIATDDEAIYSSIDRLYARLRLPGFSISRISKVLCRKRSGIIPMLDSVLQDFLYEVASKWALTNTTPVWFSKWWFGGKDTEVSPYLRMIRQDLLANEATLREIRRILSEHTETTGVPIDAPLLRIWESIVFWHEQPKGNA